MVSARTKYSRPGSLSEEWLESRNAGENGNAGSFWDGEPTNSRGPILTTPCIIPATLFDTFAGVSGQWPRWREESAARCRTATPAGSVPKATAATARSSEDESRYAANGLKALDRDLEVCAKWCSYPPSDPAMRQRPHSDEDAPHVRAFSFLLSAFLACVL